MSSGTGAQFYLGKRIDKIEHKEKGACTRIEMRKDANNANQLLNIIRVNATPIHTTFCNVPERLLRSRTGVKAP